MNCTCGRDKSYNECCGLVHQSISNALKEEDLMRSRYVAFTKGMGDYLMESHHSLTRDLSQKNEIVNWANSVKWLNLEILEVQEGEENDMEGIVEFKAHFKERLRKNCIHERSKFLREYGVWKYFGIVE